jgi:hypothetical protein
MACRTKFGVMVVVRQAERVWRRADCRCRRALFGTKRQGLFENARCISHAIIL